MFDQMITRIAAPLAVGLMMAGSASAQAIEIPAQCEAFATVHKDSCLVTSYARCSGNVLAWSFVDGELTDTHVFGPGWDLAGYFADGDRMGTEAVQGSEPEMSLQDALETGESSGSREMMFTTGVLKDSSALMEARVTFGDERIEMNGTTLRVGRMSRKFTIQKNGVTGQWDFDVYATEDASLFIEGSAVVDQFGRETHEDWTPRKISYPGDAGFLASSSDIACN